MVCVCFGVLVLINTRPTGGPVRAVCVHMHTNAPPDAAVSRADVCLQTLVAKCSFYSNPSNIVKQVCLALTLGWLGTIVRIPFSDLSFKFRNIWWIFLTSKTVA